MKIYIASDHAGFELKESLKFCLSSHGYEAEDLGNFEYDENDDYPDFVSDVAKKVAHDPENCRGIILGGSGQGEAICANRYRGVRAIVYYGSPKSCATPSVESLQTLGVAQEKNLGMEIIRLSREHNNANILSLGARFISEDEAKKAVRLWLETEFKGEERHARRISKLDAS